MRAAKPKKLPPTSDIEPKPETNGSPPSSTPETGNVSDSEPFLQNVVLVTVSTPPALTLGIIAPPRKWLMSSRVSSPSTTGEAGPERVGESRAWIERLNALGKRAGIQIIV